MGRGVRRHIVNKLGRNQVVRVKHLKAWNRTHVVAIGGVRRADIYVSAPNAYELAMQFDEWAYGNVKGWNNRTSRQVASQLNSQVPSIESDGTIQYGADFTDTGRSSANRAIKLRIDPRQNSMHIYLRGYEYKT